jgi:phosphoesterase RecJ-like protein
MTNSDTEYTEILNFISKNDNFVLTTHLSADGDAYGSVLAMAYLLEQWGKNYQVIIHDQEKEEKYNYLWGWGKIQSYQDCFTPAYDAAIVVDVPSRSRIGDPAVLLPRKEKCVKIDHHPVEEDFTEYNLVDTSASSTCQLVYELVIRSDIGFDTQLSDLLLSGIMYDTGRFSFSNTNKRDFEIAAQLVSFGSQPNQIATHLFFNNNFQSLKIVGYGLANMESHLEGKVCVIYLPAEIMQKASQLDIEDLTNYSIAIKGVEVGLFIRQPKPNFVKVSFRSKGRVDVNKIARVFGGGGHVHAAGCRLSGRPEEIKNKIIAEIKAQL